MAGGGWHGVYYFVTACSKSGRREHVVDISWHYTVRGIVYWLAEIEMKWKGKMQNKWN